MAKRFTDSQLKGLKPTNKRKILYEDGGRGFGIRVEPSGRKSFFLEYRFGVGKERRNRVLTIGLFPKITLTKARSVANQSLEQIELGFDPGAIKSNKKSEDRNAFTITDLVEEYLNKWAKVHKKEGSYKEDKRLLEKDVIPAWGKRKAKDIRKRDIVILLDEIVERGALITANRTLAVISKMFNFSVERDILDASPCVAIPKPSKETPRDRVLSAKEIKKFWQKLPEAKMSEQTRLILKFLLITAQRKIEVVEAEWAEFDLKKGWWQIPAERNKNNRLHRVPLTQMAMDVLKDAKNLSGKSRLVFPTPARPRTLSQENLDKPMTGPAIDHALRNNLIDDPETGRVNIFKLDHFTPHDLRTTVSTSMTESGIILTDVSKVLNHKDGGVTSRHYDHYSYDKEKKKALEKWARCLQSIISGEPPGKIVELKNR